MVNERSEHKAYGFWFLFEKFYKDLKRVNVKKLLLSAQQFFCTASTLLPRVEVCFNFILLPDRSKARSSLNNGPKQSKMVTKMLSFLTICCESLRSTFFWTVS